MKNARVDIAIIGAGPYGLSVAAHLAGSRRTFRIFGTPMRFWANHMPRGMCLKSEGFASSLYEPKGRFTLETYCAEHHIPYADIGLPVRLELFISYARQFQQRYVPELEPVDIVALARERDGFRLSTSAGEALSAREVVVATGIRDFAYLPPELAGRAGGRVTHSCEHSDLSGFNGQRVLVIGAGASSFDLADLLVRAGAQVEIVARRQRIDYNERPVEHRSLLARLRAPRSGLGTGWRSRMCSDMPLVFHVMPQRLRLRAVRHHLGPAPCWFVKESIVGRVPVHAGCEITGVAPGQTGVQLTLRQASGEERALAADHVVSATGYRVALSRLKFMDPAVQAQIRKVDDTPVLDRHFQCSIPGLYFVGSAAANSFGPLLRFAYGARFAAQRITARLGG